MAFLRVFSRCGRTYSYSRVWSRNASKFTEERMAEEAHAKKTLYLWKKISLFIAVPGIAYLTWENFVSNVEHVGHREYHPWPHLRIRNKPFPWGDGDKTLFHNPHTNPCPESEEEEEESEVVNPQSTLSILLQKKDILWQKYLLEDPVKRDEVREEHLARMQKRFEDYQEKKKMAENPIQPLRDDFQKKWTETPVNPVEGIQNLT